LPHSTFSKTKNFLCTV